MFLAARVSGRGIASLFSAAMDGEIWAIAILGFVAFFFGLALFLKFRSSNKDK